MNKTMVAVLAVVVALFSGLLVVSAGKLANPPVETIIEGNYSGDAGVIRNIPNEVGAETSVSIADNTVETSVRIAD
jgi:hypothetical protein